MAKKLSAEKHEAILKKLTKFDAENWKVIMVVITRKEHDKVRQCCLKNNLSLQELVQRALSEYLESVNAKNVANEVFREFGQALKRGGCQTTAVGSFIQPKTRRHR